MGTFKMNIELSEMIVELRRELLKAQQHGEKEDLKFHVEDIDVELQVAVAKEAQTKGGVKFWVCTAEAGGKLGSQTVHTLRLKLKPIASEGKLHISDRDKKPGD
jgi:hypothetical protein